MRSWVGFWASPSLPPSPSPACSTSYLSYALSGGFVAKQRNHLRWSVGLASAHIVECCAPLVHTSGPPYNIESHTHTVIPSWYVDLVSHSYRADQVVCSGRTCVPTHARMSAGQQCISGHWHEQCVSSITLHSNSSLPKHYGLRTCK